MAEKFDVVVLGSGAAGLTAAFTAAASGLSVGVFEKAAEVGGTTAWSGGNVWIPNNPLMAGVGVHDSDDEAFTYLMSLSRGLLSEPLVRAYLQAGPEMVEFLDARAGTEFYVAEGFPDYHPEHPGGKPEGGRTLETPLFPFDELGAWHHRVTPGPYFAELHLVQRETPIGAAVPQPPSAEELARRRIRDERGRGQSLVGRLLKACLDSGVVVRTDHRATELVVRDGRVSGVRFDGSAEVDASRGVVLATGGFEWNEEYKKAFLRGPLTHPVTMPTSEGDGLRMAMKVGVSLGNMREAWWSPVAVLPDGVNPMNRVMVNADRTRPRSIIVNRSGRRFTNEAANYNAFGGAFHAEDVTTFDYANLPCWLVFDQEYLRRYGTVGPYPPNEEPPPWLITGASLGELADRLGVPADEFERTVTRWNGHAAAGHDPDFRRGESAHDRWWGDPYLKGKPEATLGPLDEPPFYAVPLVSGALGTKGGPQTDAEARVLDLDGVPIEGFYAAGNVMASPFGMTYGGAGGTLGPAMVYGYIAGRHLAGRPA
ncbi:FAD-dependent oxidoreductase [Cryptosporangium aurantiacum]|uniref:FAD binding domain-containing protein n=1 Tax=Cryptosporangium aurantiacum TaxID=134849 RepID=A0A1M7PN08_9ACTN|nr:FAD-dependent oxidoreductase [Cryptosporangium aurantiacum]SHN18497.1 FAD binding domain-containing protein [Cryptosporangium aurantiacum]